jgi:DNA modification methylase
MSLRPKTRKPDAIPEVVREVVSITKLKEAPYNPRKISKKAADGLAASIARWGVVQEVVANRRNGNIIGGHQRVAALKLALASEVPVCWVDLDDAEERALNVALNNPHISGEFDESLATLLSEISDGIGVPAMEELCLDDLIPTSDDPLEGATDPDDVPDAPVEPRSKPGDVWVLGEHRLVCGDSTSTDVLAALMVGALADCVWTDPPYGVAYVGKTKDALTIENDDLDDAGLTDFLRAACAAAFVSCRDGAAWYVAAPAGPLFHCFGTVLKELEVWRHTLVWAKSSIVLSRCDYHYKHEPIFYGWKPGAAHTWKSDRKQSSVLEFDKPSRNGVHPTMKPVELVEYCIGNSSKRGDVVLDIFGGSGTTMMACERTGRKARLVELDPRYVDVIVKRWEDFTERKAVLEVSDA